MLLDDSLLDASISSVVDDSDTVGEEGDIREWPINVQLLPKRLTECIVPTVPSKD